jgi:nitrogen fixation protein NifX
MLRQYLPAGRGFDPHPAGKTKERPRGENAMSETILSRDIALRIALAARTLPDTDVARLLKVLADAVGLPPTEALLSGLTVKQLLAAADGEFSDIDREALKSALARLKGHGGASAETLPQTQPWCEGDMPDAIRVACASNKGEELDGHFGSCSRFLIYQVSRDEIRLTDVREAGTSEESVDKNTWRAHLISDCQVLFVASIGGPAAAQVVKTGIHPVKDPAGGNARSRLAKLQEKLASAPPPWLAKAMGHAAEDRVRFTTGDSTD